MGSAKQPYAFSPRPICTGKYTGQKAKKISTERMKKELILGWRDVRLPIGIQRGDGETEMMR
jgi:hypothetical protein